MPSCRQPRSGEYWWRQPDPVPVAVMALLTLPSRISIAVSYDAEERRQSLTLALSQSETGLDHLTLQPLAHYGPATAATADLFMLLMNTLVTLLQRHCQHGLSVGGTVCTRLDKEHGGIDLPWQAFGFQLLGEVSQNRRRVLARVRNLHLLTPASRSSWPPHQLPWQEVQWQ